MKTDAGKKEPARCQPPPGGASRPCPVGCTRRRARVVSAGAFIKAVLERGLQAELADHLGYDSESSAGTPSSMTERGGPAGRGSPNSRTGPTPEAVQTEVGPVAFDQPRVPGLLQRAGWYRLRRLAFHAGYRCGALFRFRDARRCGDRCAARHADVGRKSSVGEQPDAHDRVLDAVVVLGFTLAGDPWGRGQGMGKDAAGLGAPVPPLRPPRQRGIRRAQAARSCVTALSPRPKRAPLVSTRRQEMCAVIASVREFSLQPPVEEWRASIGRPAWAR